MIYIYFLVTASLKLANLSKTMLLCFFRAKFLNSRDRYALTGANNFEINKSSNDMNEAFDRRGLHIRLMDYETLINYMSYIYMYNYSWVKLILIIWNSFSFITRDS